MEVCELRQVTNVETLVLTSRPNAYTNACDIHIYTGNTYVWRRQHKTFAERLTATHVLVYGIRMTWVWLDCRVCGREVRDRDLRWCPILKMEACDVCRRKAEKKGSK